MNKSNQDIAKLQGTWQQVYLEVDGQANPPEDYGPQPTVTFVGNTFVVSRADGTCVIQGTFDLDASKNPKEITWTDEIGEDAGRTFPAIYALSDDEFVFCAADEHMSRPVTFNTRVGDTLRKHRRVR